MNTYLNLVFLLFLLTSIQAFGNSCDDVKIDAHIWSSKSCLTGANGKISVKLSKDYNDYNFVWTDLASNTKISTVHLNYAYKLKVGDYRLSLSPKDNPNCTISKEFFVHGRLIKEKGACPDINKEHALDSITIFQNLDGRWNYIPEGFKGKKIIYRVNNSNGTFSAWDIIPKPSATSPGEVVFKQGNRYEFAATPDFNAKGFVLSQPIVGNIIHQNKKGCTFIDRAKIDAHILPSVSCSNPNGKISARLSKDYNDYSLVWTDLANNKKISTVHLNYAYKLKVGDYKLTISPKNNPSCILSKNFFVHGILINEKGACPDINKEHALDSITIVQNLDGTWKYTTEGFKGKKIIYRVNNFNSRASAWDIIPKPSATTPGEVVFKQGNRYEFAAAPEFDSKGFVLSQPIVGNIIYENSNKLTSKLNESLTISPQPATDNLFIKLAPDFEAKSIEIMNLNGVNLISSETLKIGGNLQLNIADLSSGLYILKINSESESLTQKFIVR